MGSQPQPVKLVQVGYRKFARVIVGHEVFTFGGRDNYVLEYVAGETILFKVERDHRGNFIRTRTTRKCMPYTGGVVVLGAVAE